MLTGSAIVRSFGSFFFFFFFFFFKKTDPGIFPTCLIIIVASEICHQRRLDHDDLAHVTWYLSAVGFIYVE